MLIASENAIKFEKESCIVFEYDFPYQNLSCCKAVINGYYPSSGYFVNLECDQIYFVIKGHGLIFYDGKYFTLKESDCFFIQHGKKYRVKGEGLTIVVSNSPKWSHGQYKHIQE